MPTRLVATPSTNALWDFTNKVDWDADEEIPYIVASSPGSWRLYLAIDGPVGTVTSGASIFWTQGALGPWFQDTSSMGGSVSRITLEFKVRVPSSRAGDSTNNVLRIGTANFAINLNLSGTTEWFCNGGGTFNIGGTTRTATWTTTPNTYSLPRDQWRRILVDVDASQNPPTLLYQVEGVTIATGTLSGANGFFDGGTNFMTLLARQNGGGGTEVMQDVQFEYIDLNINGSDYVRISGNAATVNALTTPFAKGGDNAV